MKINLNQNYNNFVEQSIIYQFFILTLKNENFFIKADENTKDLHLYSTRLVFEFYILLSDKNYKINDFKPLSDTSQKILALFKNNILFKL